MFIGSNPLTRGGAKIYQPIKALVATLCNITTYISNGVPVEVPFVPCNQMYIASEVHTVNGMNLIMKEVVL